MGNIRKAIVRPEGLLRKEDHTTRRTVKQAWWPGRVARSLGLSAALATLLISTLPATSLAAAQGWDYILSIEFPKGRTIVRADGRVIYTRQHGEKNEKNKCHIANTTGRVAATVDGAEPANLYIKGRDCKTGKPFRHLVASDHVGADNKTKKFHSDQLPNVKDVSVELCAKPDLPPDKYPHCVEPNPRRPTDGGRPVK